ncbi:MAG: ribonuclease HI family protein [Pseudomonadota bacterium]
MPTQAPAAATSNHHWTIHCDGSAHPNPGNMGLGAILVAPDGTRHELSLPAAGRGCNNEAEARAMTAALQRARKLGAGKVHIHSDSRVVVDQLTGDGGPAIERLGALFAELRRLLATFDEASVKWIPQHRNQEADALARTAAGLPPRPVARPAKSKAGRR